MPNDDKLAELARKIDSAKQGELYKQATGDVESPPQNALQVGLEIVSGLGVGGFIGFFLDKTLETKPLFFIVLMFLGFAGGCVNAIRKSKQE